MAVSCLLAGFGVGADVGPHLLQAISEDLANGCKWRELTVLSGEMVVETELGGHPLPLYELPRIVIWLAADVSDCGSGTGAATARIGKRRVRILAYIL